MEIFVYLGKVPPYLAIILSVLVRMAQFLVTKTHFGINIFIFLIDKQNTEKKLPS